MKEVVLDTETTGISVKEGHRIVEIGCIELDNLVPTKNKPLLGSVPHITEGAPSHFVCMKPVLLSDPSILRSSFKKDTAALQPSTP